MHRGQQHARQDGNDQADPQAVGQAGRSPTAVCAAISIMPSMPMLITAARSLMTPHSAASAIGVARTRELLNMPTRLNDLPRAPR